jgi:hypothetical protein
MRRQLVGQVVSVEPDVHQVHGQRELVGVQHAVLVDVRQFPDLAQNVVRKLRLDHLLLGGCKETQKNSLGQVYRYVASFDDFCQQMPL